MAKREKKPVHKVVIVEHQIIIIGDALVTSDCFLKK